MRVCMQLITPLMRDLKSGKRQMLHFGSRFNVQGKRIVIILVGLNTALHVSF